MDYVEAIASAKKDIPIGHDDPVISEVIEGVAQQRVRVSIKAMAGNGIIAFTGLDGTARIPGSTSFVADLDAALKYGTERILDKKLPRMAKVAGYDKKILLIWSALPVADASDMARIMETQSLPGIDGVFLVKSGVASLAVNYNLSL